MSNTVTIIVGEQEFELDAELFRQYKDAAFKALDAADKAKEDLKAEIDSIAETTGLKKGILGKFIRKLHKAELDAAKGEVKDFEALRSVITGTAPAEEPADD